MGEMILMVGEFLAFVGYIWIIIVAFQTNVLWGCLSIIPLAGLIFVFTHWEEGKQPFMAWLGGVILSGVGAALS